MPADNPFRVAFLGPSKGGKTFLLTSIIDSASLNLHGYELNSNLRIFREEQAAPHADTEAESDGDKLFAIFKTIIERDHRPPIFVKNSDHFRGSEGVDATNTFTEMLGYLTFESHGQIERTDFHVFDSPGELLFMEQAAEAIQDVMFLEKRVQVLKMIAEAGSIVISMSFSQVSNPNIIENLTNNLKFVATLRESMPAQEPMRVVIALTRYDALFLNLGPLGFEAASEPEVARAAIRKALMPHRGMFEELCSLDVNTSSSGQLDIRFVPTSSFGFLPRFACPNIDPSNRNEAEIQQGKSPNLFTDGGTGRKVFPFLTADPFVFAITGRENDFFVSVPDALGIPAAQPEIAEPDPDDIPAGGHDPESPWSFGDATAAGTNDQSTLHPDLDGNSGDIKSNKSTSNDRKSSHIGSNFLSRLKRDVFGSKR